MIRLLLRSIGVGIGLACLVGLGLSGLVAQAQLMPPGKDDNPVLGGKVESEMKPVEKNRLTDLRSGKRSLIDAGVKDETEQNRQVIKKGALVAAYRLTWPSFQGQGDEKDKSTEGMADLIQEMQRQLLLLPVDIRKKGLNPNQQAYLAEFSKEFVQHLREVLKQSGKPIVRVNAARMLALVAEAGYEEAADTLLEIIKNPAESDAVKLYALHGLRELFAQGSPEKSIVKDDKREAACILALIEFIKRPGPPMGAPPEEIDAFRYVRREAIRALAYTRYPMAPGKKGPEGQSALVLLRVARKDGIAPEPSLSEQLEAAIGLAQMHTGLSKDYQPDYAAHNIGQVVVYFVGQQNTLRVTPGEPGVAWKHYAARLSQALDEMKASSATAPGKGAAEFVAKLVTQAKEPLRLVWDAKDANPSALDEWLRKNLPPSDSLYKGDKDSAVKPGI